MANVTYRISGKADNKAINDTQSALKGLGGMANVVKGGIAAIATMAVIKGFQALGKSITETTNAFKVQQTAIANLSVAVNNNSKLASGSLQRLIDLSGKLQKNSIFGDEELQKQASYLASLQLTETQIQSVLEASIGMASSGIMPLDAAVKNVAKTFGGMAGELGEKIPELRTLTKEQLQAGEAVALLQKNFAGYAETAVNTLAGSEKQVQNIIGDIKEKIGGIFGVFKMGFLQILKPVLEGIDTWLAENQTKILNLIIRFPEIFKVVLASIQSMLKTVFTIDFWINYFSAVGQLGIQAFKSIFNVAWSIVQAIGTALWEPLKYGFNLLIADIQFVWAKTINTLSGAIEFLVNGAIKGINAIIDGANKIPGVNLQKVNNISLNKLDEKVDKPTFNGNAVIDAFRNIGTTFVNELKATGNQLKDSWGQILSPLSDDFTALTDNLNTILNSDLPENIKAMLQPAVVAIADVADVVSGTGSTSSGSGPNIMGDMSILTLLKEFVKPLTDMIGGMESVKMILDPLQIVFQGIFDVLKPIIDSLLRPLIGIFRIIGETIGKVLAPLLLQLSPIIELISKAFVFLYNYAIKPLANSIIWVISSIYNLVSKMVNGVIGALNKIPFVNISWRMAEMNYDSMKLQDISTSDLDSAGSRAGVGYSGGGSAASYTGQRDITNNIYIDIETINGTNREAAMLFLDEIKSAIKLGLASY